MIQRIQTVYMLIAGVIAAMPILFGLDWLRTLLFAISAVVALYTIFKYKKRNLQQLLNWLNIVINFTLLGIFVYRMLNSSGEVLFLRKVLGFSYPCFLSFFCF